MSVKSPKLDNRTLPQLVQQLLSEADKAFAATPAIRWKFANKDVSEEDVRALLAQSFGDAGLMLSLIFARLLEITLERLNKVPEKNLLAFLDTMGVSLLPPSPAKAPLTFSLTPGNPATRVPQGTQAGTQPSGDQEAVIFETEDDLTVIPAQLTVGFTIDPTWDRYTNQTSKLAGQHSIGFTPFVGTKRMPHVLYLGDDTLLNFSRASDVTVSFNCQCSGSKEEVKNFFKGLSYRYRTQDTVIPIEPQAINWVTDTDDQVTIDFTISDRIDRKKIQGVGLKESVESRWLKATLTTPFPDTPVAQDLRLSNLKLKVSASGLLPDFAFSNTAPVDVTKDFYPFGETPKVGDAFYLGRQEVFSKPNANVKLSVKIKPSPPPTLIWEYRNGETWTQLPRSRVDDGTKSFTQSGTISLSLPSNVHAFRARIQDGNYRGFPRVDVFVLERTTLKEETLEDLDDVVLSDADFPAQVDSILFVENELVRVIDTQERCDVKVFKVTPSFSKTHEAGAPVELRRISDCAIANLAQASSPDHDYLTVDIAGDFENVLELLASVGALMVDDPDDPSKCEFVVVSDVEPLPGGNFKISLLKKPGFPHSKDTPLHLVMPSFWGMANGSPVYFSKPFYPFGKQPSVGKEFLCSVKLPSSVTLPRLALIARSSETMGLSDMQPDAEDPSEESGESPSTNTGTSSLRRINIHAELIMENPNIQLTWDFLGKDGWQEFASVSDGTSAFLKDNDNDIVFPSQPLVATEVNGQSSYWIRVRISGGNYGRPIEYVPDPEDPTKGFKVKEGTGNLNPPVITKLTLGYEAQRAPTVLTRNGFLYTDQTSANEQPGGFAPFVSVRDVRPDKYADTEPSFYLGFDEAFPEQSVSLSLYVAIAPRAFSGRVVKETWTAPTPSSALPALRWEYFNGTTWRELMVFDGTNNLTESGTVKFLTPTDIKSLAKFDLTEERYWIRARSSENDPFDTQQVLGVFLNTTPAIQAVTVQNETLGSSNGEANQTFRFTRTPILSGQQVMVCEPELPSDEERQEIENEEDKKAIQKRVNPETGETEIWIRWHEVPNFLQSDPRSRHYTLDHTTGLPTSGLLTFGDGKRGLIPPRGTNNIVVTYRIGGGAGGNKPKADIAQVKSPLPAIASVTNPIAADGGAEVETVAMVEDRGPQTLRHRHRAVAFADLEWLARQAVGTRVARARCLPNINRDLRFEPGWATLIIVPRGTESKLSPSTELIRQVEDYLEEKAFAGLSQVTPARINVIGPGYIQVTVLAEVVPEDIDEAEQVKQRVQDALNKFLHPLTGGPNGTGWVFGRDVYASEVYKVIEDVSGVSHVKTLQLNPNIAQHRLTFTPALVSAMDLPEGSAVIRTDSQKERQKSALLAEPVLMGAEAERIAVKGFKEGDRITKVLDVKVQPDPNDSTRADVSNNMITVYSFNSDAVGFPRGSLVMTFDGTRRTRLKRGIPRSSPGESTIEVEDATFASDLKPNGVLTVFYPFPMTITSVTMETITLTVQSVLGSTITVAPFNSTAAGLSCGSLAMTFDGTWRTHLAQDIPSNQTGLTQIFVQDESFAASLKQGDWLKVQVPVQTLAIESYETEVAFPEDSLLATLDNRVRLPLLAEVAADKIVSSIKLRDFASQNEIRIARRDGTYDTLDLTVQRMQPASDIVYLDDNFLVYPGAHHITMVSDTGTDSKE